MTVTKNKNDYERIPAHAREFPHTRSYICDISKQMKIHQYPILNLPATCKKNVDILLLFPTGCGKKLYFYDKCKKTTSCKNVIYHI